MAKPTDFVDVKAISEEEIVAIMRENEQLRTKLNKTEEKVRNLRDKSMALVTFKDGSTIQIDPDYTNELTKKSILPLLKKKAGKVWSNIKSVEDATESSPEKSSPLSSGGPTR